MDVALTDNGGRAAAARTGGVPVVPWAIVLAVFWTLVAVLSLAWNIVQVRELVLEQARVELRANFFKDWAFRNWASRHGGVYVPVTPESPVDPYGANFPERDVRTPSGRVLTLINPALMVRQFNELAAEPHRVRGHLSGLRPINPQNRPDPWEAKALAQFQQGVEEVTGIAEIDAAPYLRLIRPMKMGGKCLACHIQQGYREGDLAGGVSVSVPLAPLNAAADRRVSALAAGHGGLWLFGLVGIGAAAASCGAGSTRTALSTMRWKSTRSARAQSSTPRSTASSRSMPETRSSTGISRPSRRSAGRAPRCWAALFRKPSSRSASASSTKPACSAAWRTMRQY